jgi:DNA-binding transcriptional LysR family regulator
VASYAGSALRSSTPAPYLLPPILAGFTRKYPLARVSVVEEITRK